MQHVHQVPKMRAAEHDFTPFTEAQLLGAYNAVSTREMRHFSDRTVLERRLLQLLDSRELMLDWYANGAEEMVTEDGVAIYALRNHPKNRLAMGHTNDYDRLIVKLLVDENPKTGKSMRRFALYEDGITTEDYVCRCEAMSGKSGRWWAHQDLRWDVGRGFIALVHPDTGEEIVKVEQFDRYWRNVTSVARKKADREAYERGEKPRPSFMNAEDAAEEIKRDIPAQRGA